MNTNFLSVTNEHLLTTWLRGTTCFHQKRSVHWRSECGRFVLLKHHSHPEYINRLVGLRTCHVHYSLFDLSQADSLGHNEVKLSGPSAIGLVIEWEGRWNKSRQTELEETVAVLLNTQENVLTTTPN